MPLWSAVCEVHDKFNKAALDELINSISAKTHLISHPESPLPVLQQSDYIGSTFGLLNWIKNYSDDNNAVILVATEDGILYNMKKARPELDIRQAPIYTGCKCNSCPYMKLNTVDAVRAAQNGTGGLVIDYLSEETIARAKQPIDRMISFSS
jgi:quinolinate synthase